MSISGFTRGDNLRCVAVITYTAWARLVRRAPISRASYHLQAPKAESKYYAPLRMCVCDTRPLSIDPSFPPNPPKPEASGFYGPTNSPIIEIRYARSQCAEPTARCVRIVTRGRPPTSISRIPPEIKGVTPPTRRHARARCEAQSADYTPDAAARPAVRRMSSRHQAGFCAIRRNCNRSAAFADSHFGAQWRRVAPWPWIQPY